MTDNEKYARRGQTLIIRNDLQRCEEVMTAGRIMAAAYNEAVKNNPDILLLKLISSVRNYTALIIASAVDWIERFHSSEKLSAYAGIVPSVRSSADIVHHDRITRIGDSILKWILIEYVHSHVRFAPHSDVSTFYYRIRKKKGGGGGGKATVVTASKMLHVMWWMLKEKREFVTNYS